MSKIRKDKQTERQKPQTAQPARFQTEQTDCKQIEWLQITDKYEHPVCFINKIHARGNFFEVCDRNYSIRTHFCGDKAHGKLKMEISDQLGDLNVLCLLGKQLKLTDASIRFV